MHATRLRAVAFAAAVSLTFAACGDDGESAGGTDSATGSTVSVTVVDVVGYENGELAGVIARASDGTVVGGFSTTVRSENFATTQTVRSPGTSDDGAETWPNLDDELATLAPGDYVVMLWLDMGLGGYTPWLPVNTDGQGLAGCVHRFEVADTSSTEVVVSGDVTATGYLGVCGSGGVSRYGQDDAAAWTESDPRSSCLPSDPDDWDASDDLAGVVDHVKLATDGETLVALGDSFGRLAVHHSDDGIAWEPGKGMPQMTLAGPVVDLAGGPDGFVAVGVTGPLPPAEPVVAFSPTGVSWEQVDPESLPRSELSWFSGVFAGSDGFVAVGTDSGRRRFQTFVWYSDDGRTWTETDLDLGGDQVTVTSTTDGWMLLSAADTDWTTEATTQVWTSANGTDWVAIDTVTVPPARALDQYLGAAPLMATDGALVLALAGAADDDPAFRSPTAWVSTDEGVTWSQHTVWDDPHESGFVLHDTAVIGSAVLLAGYQDQPGGPGVEFVHHSRDGMSWQHCWTDPLEFSAIEPFGDALVGITGTGTVYVWIEP